MVALISTGVQALAALTDEEIHARIVEHPDHPLTPWQEKVRDEFTDRQNYRAGCKKVSYAIPQHFFGFLGAEISKRNLVVEHALDLATGTGEVASLFKDAYPDSHVTGVELARNKVSLAVADGFVDEAHVTTITNLGWARDAHYHAVTLSGAMEFIPPDEIPALAAEFMRVLHPGGIFGLTFSAEDSKNPGPKGDIVHRAQDLLNAFKDVGASVWATESFSGWTLSKNFAAMHGETLKGDSRPVEVSCILGCAPA